MGGMEAKVEIWNICFVIGKGREMWEREIDEMVVLPFRSIVTGCGNVQTGTL